MPALLRGSILLLLCSLGATSASAFELRLIATTPTELVPGGDLLSYDVFLDTQGESGISRFSASLTFDRYVLSYEPELSNAESYYPLYAPPVGKGEGTWLVPEADPPALWPTSWPEPAQVNLAFTEANMNETVATATNLYLGTLSFRYWGGYSVMSWSLENEGNAFVVGGVDVSDSVNMVNTGPTVGIPEPGKGLLFAMGLLGLWGAARARA